MNALPKYSFQVSWSDQDSAYLALSPEFPGLSGFGDNAEDAIRELKVAIELAAETLEEEGRSLPKPTVASEFSGQFRLRLPKSIHEALSYRALGEGVSLNTLALCYLSQGLGREVATTQCTEDYRSLLADWQFAFADIVSAVAEFRLQAIQNTDESTFQDPTLRRLYDSESRTSTLKAN